MTVVDRLLSGPKTQLLIDGDWTTGSDQMDVIDPATESVLATVGLADQAQAMAAVDAAHAAAPDWAATPPRVLTLTRVGRYNPIPFCVGLAGSTVVHRRPAGACLTRLSSVRWTDRTRDRGTGHPHHQPVERVAAGPGDGLVGDDRFVHVFAQGRHLHVEADQVVDLHQVEARRAHALLGRRHLLDL